MKRPEKNMNNLDVENFWTWFETNKELFRPEIISNENIDKLNSKILSLGDFDWEIREGITKENLLIISPGGNLDLIESTKSVIALAPLLSEWEFLHYKPSKKWDYKLSIEEGCVKRMIDASEWEYVLFKFNDGCYDVLIKAHSISSLDVDYQYDLIDLVLENILGEEMSFKLIKNVEIVSDFDKESIDKKSNIKCLKEHLTELDQYE